MISLMSDDHSTEHDKSGQKPVSNTLGEFGRIARFFASLTHDEETDHLGNDAALLSVPEGMELVVTTDSLVESVHFLPEDSLPDKAEQLALKVLGTNLSDLASMGAKPWRYSLSLATTERQDDQWFESFAKGLASSQREQKWVLSGGDSVRSLSGLVVTVTAMGLVPKGRAFHRKKARAGQLLWVSGTLGDAATGLRILTGKVSDSEDENAAAFLKDRYHLPQPRTALGWRLQDEGLTQCCLDVSDGLLADAGHLSRESAVRIVIHAESLPLSDALISVLPPEGQLEMAATGGDDYELLFTAEPEETERLKALSLALGIQLTPIGIIEEGQGVVFRDQAGQAIAFSRSGWVHS